MAYQNPLTPCSIQFLVIGACLLSLIFAYAAEYGFGIRPCDFCLYERMVYAAVLLIGVLSFTGHNWLGGNRANTLQLLVLVAGIGLTLYHIGMEQRWWEGPASCSSAGNATTIEAFRNQLKNARPRCDQINWAIWGVSATIWNLLAQVGLLILLTLSIYLRKSCLPKA